MIDEEREEAERVLQRKAERLVQREVLLCMSGWVGWAEGRWHDLGSEDRAACPVDLYEIPVSLPCEACEGTGFGVYRDERGRLYELTYDAAPTDCGWVVAARGESEGCEIAVNLSEECGECDGDGQVDVEVLEWWAVSSYLGGKLQAAGEVVLDSDFGKLWGRQTSGQAIAGDEVIRGFARDLGPAWAE